MGSSHAVYKMLGYHRGSLLCCDTQWIDLDEHMRSRIKSIATDCRAFRFSHVGL